MHLVLASQHLITLITVITPIIIIIVGFISTFPQLSYSDLCNTSFSFAFSALHTQNHLQRTPRPNSCCFVTIMQNANDTPLPQKNTGTTTVVAAAVGEYIVGLRG